MSTLPFDPKTSLSMRKDYLTVNIEIQRLDKIAIFKWEDAAGKTNWSESDEPLSTMFAVVCGIFIREDNHSISIGLERFDDGQWRETLTIPKTLIQGKIKYFTIPQYLKTSSKKE